ncbi:hypothetical protein NEOLEDRAFT_1096099 [Neolentinus lepideus HHB14362 ss-1]|uniref:BZIP domain-containing protein n=1 Tax=Neolentinus lepideus HHB14362 ss-1 TaxID=1314782 RepID=A0A165R7F4_9AGAM|nr:hypothetical protein NEOLEDRAFT_1096099 [Neolentinus lepideus HHB14362 ss-1]
MTHFVSSPVGSSFDPSGDSSHMGRHSPRMQTVSQTSCVRHCYTGPESASPKCHSPTHADFSSADDAEPSHSPVNSTLTWPSSPHSRRNRPPALSPAQQHNLTTPSEIPPLQNNYNAFIDQNVLPYQLSAAHPAPSRSISRHHGHIAARPLESNLSSVSPNSSQHESITHPSSRLRTLHSVSYTVSDLASQYGIPQQLPPVPRTTPRHIPEIVEPSEPAYPTFPSILSNYLAMLSEKPEDGQTTAEERASAVAPTDQSVQAIMDVLQASPAFTSSPDFNDSRGFSASPEFDMLHDFLTSPMDDSPLEDFLSTPVMADTDIDQPAVYDASVSGSLFSDMPIYGDDTSAYADGFNFPKMSSQTALTDSSTLAPFDDLISMSPNTPSLDPSSLFESPASRSQSQLPPSSESTPALEASTRKSRPTGTRKNIMPAALVPIDAPTQKRTYYTPSVTSRKEVPAVFARKRARSAAFGEEEDQLADGAGATGLTMSEQEAIEAKRRQNTLAARRSRKRKLEYQRQLEEEVEKEKQEKEMWKTRALTMRSMLVQNGMSAPTFDD